MQTELKNVTLTLKANVYFDGGVVSHSIATQDGKKQTAGIIRKGEYHFTTGAPEQMDVIAGTCRVRLAGEKEWKNYEAGKSFKVAGKSSFDIAVDEGTAEYLCSFLS